MLEQILGFGSKLSQARKTTSGLLFFFPLGMLIGSFIASAMFFYSRMPEKGIFGGEQLQPRAVNMSVLGAWTLFVCMCAWVYCIYEASKDELYPKWTSFFSGLLFGSIAGVAGMIVFYFLFIVFIFVLLVAELVSNHVWASLIITILIGLMIILPDRYGSKVEDEKSPTD